MKTKESDTCLFVGVSAASQIVHEEIGYAARSDAKVLLTGESGVGKEVVARLVHAWSARRAAPLVTINCAGMPDTLLESELFGHERGSFTGAYRTRTGLLEQASGGTIFMDEVGEMSPRMQTLLLRFLETGEIQRVGSDGGPLRTDVRVIAATNRNLMDRIAAREFREDLYYRLNVVHICIPPLRDRRDDIPALLEHYLSVFAARYQVAQAAVSADALAMLQAYDWPGNVRQLRNIVERLMVRQPGAVITPADLESILPRASVAAPAPPAPVDASEALFRRIVDDGESFWTAVYEPFMLRDLTRRELRGVIRRGLEETHGNCKRLVRLFNMEPGDYKRFLNFLHKHGCNLRFQLSAGSGTSRPAGTASRRTAARVA